MSPSDTAPIDISDALRRMAGFLLLLAAGAAALVVLLRANVPRRAFRVHAARWRRLPWQSADAACVVLGTLFLLSGHLLPAWAGHAPESAPSPPSSSSAFAGLILLPLLPAALCAFRAIASNRRRGDVIGLRPATWRRDVAWGVVGGLALLLPTLAVSHASGLVLQRCGLPPEAQDAMRWFRDATVPTVVRVLIAFQAVCVAPVVEEILHRSVLLSVTLRSRRPAVAILLTALLFASLHLNALVLAPLFLVGVALAMATLATGSLTTPLIMHIVFNAGNLLLVCSGL